MWRLYLGITLLVLALAAVGGLIYGLATDGIQHPVVLIRSGIVLPFAVGFGIKLMREWAEYRLKKQTEEDVLKLIDFAKSRGLTDGSLKFPTEKT